MLDCNDFAGHAIPAEWGELSHLKMISLQSCRLGGELPLTIGVLKARGCEVKLEGNEGFELSRDTSTVATAKALDYSFCHLRGAAHTLRLPRHTL